MTYAWVAVEARTGLVIADLPDLACSAVSVTLGDYTSASATLPYNTAPENWERATEGAASILVLLDMSADPNGLPVWGGLIIKRERTEEDSATLSLATLEAYFDRRYVGDKVFSQVDQNEIVTDLINAFAVAGTNGGIPFTVEVIGDAGKLRDRTYKDIGDKTVYSDLQELMNVIDGPEWTVVWKSGTADSGERTITPVVQVGSRIGLAKPDGLDPNATFDMTTYFAVDGTIRSSGGNLQSFTYTEDWSSSSGGANDVMATSTADGDTRPQSAHEIYTDPDRPTFEYRFTPSTSITSVPTLNEHAQSELAAIKTGVNELALTAVVSDGVRLGVDWSVGDDIGYDILTPAFPKGLKGYARSVAWQLNFGELDTITPTLSLSETTGTEVDNGNSTDTE